MFQPDCLLYCIIKISCSYNTEDRHHQLSSDQRVFLWPLKYDTADICRYIYSDHGKECSCIPAYAFTVQLSACQNNFCKFVLLFLRSKIAVILSYKIVHQLIYDRGNCYDLFLGNTWKIVIKCTSVYNICGCFADISGFINQCRRISGACSDTTFTGRKNCSYNSRSAGCSDKRDVFMFHHHIACLKCRFLYSNCNVVRTTAL